MNRSNARGHNAARILRGTVQSGKGQARGFTQLDWVRAQFIAKLGFEPYPGTLNLVTQDVATAEVVRAGCGIIIEPPPNFCAAHCYRVKLNGRLSAVWLVPDIANYPAGQVEMVAPMSLREALGLKDGSIVTFQLTGEM